MQTNHIDHGGSSHGNKKSYITGFVLSIILTVIPFWLVMQHPNLARTTIIGTIVALAVVQILVHLVYFLHMNSKSEQRWNVLSFAFTILIVALLVGGSVWIMENMTTTLMPPQHVMNDR
jgi:cytochrome o ubiquinol oxidase operon protein cyoD